MENSWFAAKRDYISCVKPGPQKLDDLEGSIDEIVEIPRELIVKHLVNRIRNDHISVYIVGLGGNFATQSLEDLACAK